MRLFPWMRRWLCGMLAVLLMGCSLILPVSALSSEELEEQLKELQQQGDVLQEQISQLEGMIGENRQEMAQLVEQKNVLDQQITLLYGQIANIDSQIALFGQLVADKQEELTAAQERHAALNDQYKRRIRAMEEAGPMSYWAILFQANSFMDLLDRLDMIQEIAAADRKRLQELREAAQLVEEAKAELEAQKEALRQTRSSLEQAQLVLEEKRGEADALLRQLVSKGMEFEEQLHASELAQEALMEEIAKSEQALEEAIAKEEAAKQPTVSEEGWMTPVASYVLTSPFGMRMHPILGYPRMHNGVDMACPAMTPIYASRSGVVSAASYQADGAGNYVQLNHGDGYRSIYMHMTYYVVTVGEYVQQGQLIGYVGNTGLSKGNHLHFGISYNGQYVNPMEYI